VVLYHRALIDQRGEIAKELSELYGREHQVNINTNTTSSIDADSGDETSVHFYRTPSSNGGSGKT
jgi:hypothetical protein